MKILALTFAATTLLVASCSTEYQPLESRAPVVREGGYGTRKVVDGVDIWTTGEPPRKYQVLGIINDERVQAPYEMHRYYHDVAAKEADSSMICQYERRLPPRRLFGDTSLYGGRIRLQRCNLI